jgi:2-haloacid dehalogenase
MIYVFDGYGTLFDIHAAVRRHMAVLGDNDQRMSEVWRAKQLEYSWTRCLMGAHRGFRKLTEEGLDYAAALFGGISPETRAALLASYHALDAYPDVEPALSRLKAEGKTLAILSNGTPQMLADASDHAGIAPLLDAVLSVEAVHAYKTDPRVYKMATDRFSVAPREINFVSSNRWDVAGATQFGFAGVWLNRAGLPDEYVDLPPKRVIASLSEL